MVVWWGKQQGLGVDKIIKIEPCEIEETKKKKKELTSSGKFFVFFKDIPMGMTIDSATEYDIILK